MERHLLPGHKRRQFELWVGAMDAYELAHPSRWGQGPSTCRIDGCEKPVRGRGLSRSHHDDSVVVAVRAFADLVDVIVPFMDEHLPPSYKRRQYLAWREELLAYDRVRRGRRR